METVEQYLAQVEDRRRGDLIRLRELIVAAAPDATEYIKYGMPYYEQNGLLCAFAAQKGYISLYMLNTPVLQKHLKHFRNLNVGKGCIRFKSITELPLDAVEKVLIESVNDNLKKFNNHC
ncbi:DUF1801 domain-containing protein [Bacillus sp. 165]|uniref:iron chaperone n=1 Tax=Bacillus sp. 165 TaxID=1529117 RepID=UPI001ADB276C|nr:DUF1801 domain-containing protein [Bacillus sp. 165]MBO9130730.1 DUF1801 domain-containing protein [Bacillus sp. 165]